MALYRDKSQNSFPTITQAFLHQVRTNPERPTFFVKQGVDWKPHTWKQFYEQIRLTSLGLMELGVKAGDCVCLISNTCLEWSSSDMAILGAKGITVPVYASNTPEETGYIVDHSDAKIVFVEDNKQLNKLLSQREAIPKIEKFVVFNLGPDAAVATNKDVLSLAALRELGARSKYARAGADPFVENLEKAKPQDVFTICYTSGTTGVPKGVVLTFESLSAVIGDVDKVMRGRVNSDDIVLSFLPISHIFGKVESMAAYHFGWTVYFAESVERLLLNMAEVKPTLLFAVPRVFEKAYSRIKVGVDDSAPTKKAMFEWALAAGRVYFTKKWNHQIPSLRETLEYQLAKRIVLNKVYARFGGRIKYCIAGGAPLSKDIGEFMRIVGITILEGYGLTETCAPVTFNTPDALRFGTIGKPLPETSIKIASDGEILIKSKKVFKEYFKNPTATNEVLTPDGWFHSGDIGLIDQDGFVKITDRKKDLIVTSGGKNIAPQKIENMAKTYKEISQLMVYGDKRNYLSALIVLEKEEIIKFAREHNILFSEYGELLKNAKIVGLIQDLIDRINTQLASFETIKRFKLLPNEFTVESGELTPSLKIRRRYCNQKYQKELDSLYGAQAHIAR